MPDADVLYSELANFQVGCALSPDHARVQQNGLKKRCILRRLRQANVDNEQAAVDSERAHFCSLLHTEIE
ncbi:hypothetical protein N2M06_12040 [Oceanimonas sp. AH20CE76]|uniref:hypothetical protein n=1 Tax=Oceanimonas sp. AH20CE76 TaxID=2977120 RepID=UPI0031FEDDB9